MNVYFDIETIPGQPESLHRQRIAETIKEPGAMKLQATIDAWHNGEGKYAGEKESAIDEAYRKQSFDGSVGEICSLAWAIGDGDIKAFCDPNISEADLLLSFFNDVASHMKHEKASPFFIGHYIGGFDLKFVFQRAVINSVKPPFAIPFSGWHGKDFFCTQEAWCGKRDNIKMDKLAQVLGIQGKGDMDGSMVWDYFQARMFEEIQAYNKDDVRIVREIHKRLSFN